ncbi:MAG: hypothetical protein Q7S87_09230 [Agitococcus sp.]|nr:hypothetical protein [Agitococcus sp.]MDO9177560.1 hypothetical protein [Agitococcus sp.]
MAIHGGRAGAEALLQIPLAAMERYQRALQTLSDVAKAEDVLQQAQLFSETVRRPGWRPEGSSKNPQQLARSMRAAARSPGMVDRAQRALLAAQELNAQQTANPFDVKQWTTLYATK